MGTSCSTISARSLNVASLPETDTSQRNSRPLASSVTLRYGAPESSKRSERGHRSKAERTPSGSATVPVSMASRNRRTTMSESSEARTGSMRATMTSAGSSASAGPLAKSSRKSSSVVQPGQSVPSRATAVMTSSCVRPVGDVQPGGGPSTLRLG
jgi:hypothetical protein